MENSQGVAGDDGKELIRLPARRAGGKEDDRVGVPRRKRNAATVKESYT